MYLCLKARALKSINPLMPKVLFLIDSEISSPTLDYVRFRVGGGLASLRFDESSAWPENWNVSSVYPARGGGGGYLNFGHAESHYASSR